MAKNKGKGKGKGKKDTSFLTKPLTKKGLGKEIKALQNLGTRGEIHQIKAEKRATKPQARRIHDWFGEYGKTVDKAKGTTQSAYNAATTSIGANSSNAANYAETLRQRLSSEGRADAANRGVAYDASSDHTSVDANLARVNAANVLSGVTSSQGATQNAYLTDKGVTGKREMTEQLLRNQERKRSYNTDLRAAQQRKGDIGITERGRLRSEERDYELGKAAAGVDKAAAKADSNYQKFAAKQQRRSLRGDRASRRGQFRLAKLQNKHAKQDDQRSKFWKNQGGGKKGGNGGASKKTYREASAYLRQRTKPSWSKQQSIDSLITTGGFSPRVAKKVYRKGNPKAKVLSDRERRQQGHRARFTP